MVAPGKRVGNRSDHRSRYDKDDGRVVHVTEVGVDRLQELRRIARETRRLIVETIFTAQAGHLGGPLSATDILVALYFEILRLDPSTAPDAIERVYHTLARRYHPDNEKTGDPEIFLKVVEAYRILNDPRRRHKYNQSREASVSLVHYQLLTPEFHAGLRGEQNRRIAVLCLLYRRRSADFEFPGLSVLDLEKMSGFTREELGFALWYLCEKQYTRVDDSTCYCLTAGGADFVENTVINERPELKPIAVI